MRVEVLARRGARLRGGDGIPELLKNTAWAIHAWEMFFRDGEWQPVRLVSRRACRDWAVETRSSHASR
jgi:hypothetical protein